MLVHQYKVEIFTTQKGREPFSEWFQSFSKDIQARIILRINRIKNGNFGDYKNLGDEIFELKINFGSGYRIYFGKDGDELIILLCAGSKKTQRQDIQRAKDYWLEYKNNNQPLLKS